jgi:hypothetical protein
VKCTVNYASAVVCCVGSCIQPYACTRTLFVLNKMHEGFLSPRCLSVIVCFCFTLAYCSTVHSQAAVSSAQQVFKCYVLSSRAPLLLIWHVSSCLLVKSPVAALRCKAGCVVDTLTQARIGLLLCPGRIISWLLVD